MSVAGADDEWDALQKATRKCAVCIELEGVLFAPFLGDFPELMRPGRRPILFVSEAPPRAGGFWKIGRPGEKKDDLREKLLPLLGLATDEDDGGLSSFVDAGFFLFQSFPRPLKFSVAGVSTGDLADMLVHVAPAHLGPQVRRVTPRAIVTLGRVAAAAVALVYPSSEFAEAFRAGDFAGVRGRTFVQAQMPTIGATYLPSGAGRFFHGQWQRDIPEFLAAFGRLDG